MTYIPMSRMTRVSPLEFERVAPHGNPEVFAHGCPNHKDQKIGSEVQLTGVSNVAQEPITCRDRVEGRMVLCGDCHAQFQQAKEAMGEKEAVGEDVCSEEFVYFDEESERNSERSSEKAKSYKDRAVDWVKEHPYITMGVAVVGTLSFVGLITALRRFPSAPPINSPVTSMPVTSKPKPVTTASKPTTTSMPVTTATTSMPVTTTMPVTTATTAEPSKSLKLNLTINNVLNGRSVQLKTTQMFQNFSSIEKQHTVPALGKTSLIFDIDEAHHQKVLVNYNKTVLPLRKFESLGQMASRRYNFGSEYNKLDESGRYVYDKNRDGEVTVSHTFFAGNGFTILNREIEDASGKATPSVTIEKLSLAVKNDDAAHSYKAVVGSYNAGTFNSTLYQLNPQQKDLYDIKAGTDRLTVRITDGTHVYPTQVYAAKHFPAPVNGSMCLHVQSAGLTSLKTHDESCAK